MSFKNWLTYSSEVEIRICRDDKGKKVNIPNRHISIQKRNLESLYKDISPYIRKQLDINPDDYDIYFAAFDKKCEYYSEFLLYKKNI